MHPFPPPARPDPYPPAPPDDEPPDAELDDDVAEVDLVDEVAAGDVVKVTWWDTANQADVVRYGTVVDVPDEGAVVAYFAEVTHPIPLDPTVHERDDAPRLEVVAPASD